MDPITLIIAASPIVGAVALMLVWDKPFFQNRAFRIALGAALLLPSLFCAFGALASLELSGAEGLSWRLRYIVLGLFTFVGALYFLFKRPILNPNPQS